MKRSIHIASLLMAVLLVTAPLASCANDPAGPDSDSERTTSAGTPGDTETGSEYDPVEEALTAVRAQADWGGKDFGILYISDFEGIAEEIEAVEKVEGTAASAVINDAVYTRNSLFEDYADLKFVQVPASGSGVSTDIANEVQSGSGDFLLIDQTIQFTTRSATSGYLYNYHNLNINYEQPWWDQGPLDFALDGKVFFMNGPFNIFDDEVTFVMMFNKRMRANYNMENPYDVVKAGRWTLDYFNTVIGGISAETSGDGKWDEKDTYGFATPPSIGTTLFYGAGLQIVKNDRDMDVPELLLSGSNMEKALEVLDTSRNIVHENHATYMAPLGQEGLATEAFIEGRAMFYCEAAFYLRSLNADMDAEYGLLPVPKYNEAQETYTTWGAQLGSTLSMPTTAGSADIDMLARALETYVLLSQKFVRPAYYDHLLTTRNVHDAESAEIVDLIFPNRIYDMAIYFDELGFSQLFALSVHGENTFTSSYAKAARFFDRQIRDILKTLQDVE